VSDWAAAARLDLEEFTAGMASANIYTDDGTTFYGELSVDDLGITFDIVIEVPANFPYGRPRASPLDGRGGLSWHRESSGHLCLYTDEDVSHLPWKDPVAFLDKVRAWYREDAAGWGGDPADLDLERYWTIRPGLAVYDRDDLIPGNLLRVLKGRAFISLKAIRRPSRRYTTKALVVSAGPLAKPPRTWEQLSDLIDDSLDADGRIRSGSIKFLAVLYERPPHQGVLILEVRKKTPIELVAIRSADCSPATLRLRSGPEAVTLKDSAIAVVGAGAIGSWIVDLLLRAGPRTLTIVDGDTVRPGNLVRHAAAADQVGLNKADAMKEIADRSVSTMAWSPTRVSTQPTTLDSIEAATALLTCHDLVIDATADTTATALLLAGAEDLQRPVVSVCLQRDGQVVRVDRAPLGAGEVYQPAIPRVERPESELRESGCGDPVSPAPPWSCSVAAALALAVTSDALTGRDDYGPSTIQVLVPQPDAPYDTIGLVR
jgi:molybdopterin/thiamine biosynthesis adenylyltransferase